MAVATARRLIPTLALVAGATVGASNRALAQWSPSRPDSHAPIGVMGDHRHHAGEVMLSYRFMVMEMAGSRVGRDRVSDADVLDPDGYGYPVTPTDMTMQMHMFGAMWAPTDGVTLLGMIPIVDRSMDHRTRAGTAFTTESGGIGDVKLGGLIGLADWGRQLLHLNAMVSLPTGSIEQRDVLPTSMGEDVQLPYPMQNGSGTLDLEPALTWLGQTRDWSWGAQGGATIRLGENDRGWTLGNRYYATGWWARAFGRSVSGSVRLRATRTENIDGSDPAPSVNPSVVPTADPDLRAGTVVEAGFGVNLYVPKWRAFRVAAEVLAPLVRDLDGPQLETDWTLVLGVQVVPVH
jgi:hypothetical protein